MATKTKASAAPKKTTPTKTVTPKPKAKGLLHEFNSVGQHRLVIIEDGKASPTKYFEAHEVGEYKGIYFAGYNMPAFPAAHGRVFKMVEVEVDRMNAYGMAGMLPARLDQEA